MNVDGKPGGLLKSGLAGWLLKRPENFNCDLGSPRHRGSLQLIAGLSF